MSAKLTEHQLMIVNGMVQICENTANQLLHIMENHGLDKVEGFKIQIDVDPQFEYVAQQIEIGRASNLDEDRPAGYCHLIKGKGEKRYALWGKNSAEYEWLFADEAVKERMREILDAGKHPLPPDGLWIGDNRNDSPVDGWEWDINDSLS